MRKVLILVTLILGISVFDAHAGSPLCGDPPSPNQNNRNPVATIDLSLHGAPQRAATIAIGAFVDVGGTPKDASGKPTKGISEPSWTFLGDETAYDAIDTDCFTPRITGKKDAIIIFSLEQDSKKSNEFRLTIGRGGAVPSPIASSSDSEDDEYCAWRDAQGFHCVSGTRANTKCENIEFPPQCASPNKCVRKTLDQCVGGDAFSSQTRPLQETPKDLGRLIQQLFNWSLGILGISIFVIMIFSGAQMLLYAGIPNKVSEARSRIQDAILGAILLLAAYLILNVINPNLVGQNTKLPPIQSGVQRTTPAASPTQTP